MSITKDSWSAFDGETAKIYLDGYGHPSERSKFLMSSVLKEMFGEARFHLADFGCGNGHLCQFFRDQGLSLEYTGYDFSTSLLNAARARYACSDDTAFVEGDIQDPDLQGEPADIVLFSHVLETLESPGASLAAARNMAPRIMIRFFEPPADRHDTAVLRMMPVGPGQPEVPYIRRSMSSQYYDMLLNDAGCKAVAIHQVKNDRDQVHVLSMTGVDD